jgi:putative tricarboxylic transport membrane protein
MDRSEKVMTLCLIATGLFFVIGGLHYGVGRFNSPNTGFMAFWVGLCMSILGTLYLFRKRKEAGSSSGGSFILRGGWTGLLIASGSLLLFVILFRPLGLIFSSLFFLVFLIRFVGKESWRSAIVIGFCGTLFIYVLFVLLLSSSFPGGVLKEYLPS